MFVVYRGRKYYSNGSGNYFYSRWGKGKIALHRKIWEDNNGEIPKGYDIHHADGNPHNNNLTNLVCVGSKKHDSAAKSKNKDLICRHCGKKYKANKGKFCSKRCYHNYQYLVKTYHEKRTCITCTGTFLVKKSELTKNCSARCAATYRWKMYHLRGF